MIKGRKKKLIFSLLSEKMSSVNLTTTWLVREADKKVRERREESAKLQTAERKGTNAVSEVSDTQLLRLKPLQQSCSDKQIRRSLRYIVLVQPREHYQDPVPCPVFLIMLHVKIKFSFG